MTGKLRPTLFLVVAYAVLSVTLFLAWTWWERLVGLAVTAVLAIGLERVSKWEAADPRRTAGRLVLLAPTWFRVAMWLGVLAGLAGTIGGVVSLVVEPDATLVGPVLAPIALVLFVRAVRIRVEVRGDEVLVANMTTTRRVRRGEVNAIEHDRGAGSANRRLRLRTRDGKVIDIGLSGTPDLPAVTSDEEVDALAGLLGSALGVTPTELVAHDDTGSVDTGPIRLREIVGAVCGIAYGAFAAPGGALAIAGLAAFIWALVRVLGKDVPQTFRTARQQSKGDAVRPLIFGRMLFYVWVAPAAGPFAVVAGAIALGRIALG